MFSGYQMAFWQQKNNDSNSPSNKKSPQQHQYTTEEIQKSSNILAWQEGLLKETKFSGDPFKIQDKFDQLLFNATNLEALKDIQNLYQYYTISDECCRTISSFFKKTPNQMKAYISQIRNGIIQSIHQEKMTVVDEDEFAAKIKKEKLAEIISIIKFVHMTQFFGGVFVDTKIHFKSEEAALRWNFALTQINLDFGADFLRTVFIQDVTYKDSDIEEIVTHATINCTNKAGRYIVEIEHQVTKFISQKEMYCLDSSDGNRILKWQDKVRSEGFEATPLQPLATLKTEIELKANGKELIVEVLNLKVILNSNELQLTKSAWEFSYRSEQIKTYPLILQWINSIKQNFKERSEKIATGNVTDGFGRTTTLGGELIQEKLYYQMNSIPVIVYLKENINKKIKIINLPVSSGKKQEINRIKNSRELIQDKLTELMNEKIIEWNDRMDPKEQLIDESFIHSFKIEVYKIIPSEILKDYIIEEIKNFVAGSNNPKAAYQNIINFISVMSGTELSELLLQESQQSLTVFGDSVKGFESKSTRNGWEVNANGEIVFNCRLNLSRLDVLKGEEYKQYWLGEKGLTSQSNKDTVICVLEAQFQLEAAADNINLTIKKLKINSYTNDLAHRFYPDKFNPYSGIFNSLSEPKWEVTYTPAQINQDFINCNPDKNSKEYKGVSAWLASKLTDSKDKKFTEEPGLIDFLRNGHIYGKKIIADVPNGVDASDLHEKVKSELKKFIESVPNCAQSCDAIYKFLLTVRQSLPALMTREFRDKMAIDPYSTDRLILNLTGDVQGNLSVSTEFEVKALRRETESDIQQDFYYLDADELVLTQDAEKISKLKEKLPPLLKMQTVFKINTTNPNEITAQMHTCRFISYTDNQELVHKLDHVRVSQLEEALKAENEINNFLM